MRRLWLAVVLVACGDVQKVPDAAIPDAYQHDASDEVSCAAGEMNCSGVCANLLTSEQYCGTCNIQCPPTQGCLNGNCVPANTTCARVREVDPAAPDGFYTNPNNGNSFYCDFTNNRTFDGIGMGQYDVTYAGWELVTLEQMQKPEFQQAFIYFYNRNGGLQLITSFVSGNCCFAISATSRWTFGGANNYLYPAIGGSSSCSPPAPGYVGSPWRIYHTQTATVLNSLPENYFITNPIAAGTVCGPPSNPGFFWRIRAGLN